MSPLIFPDLPCVNITSDAQKLKQGSKQWQVTSQEIMQALDTHGYFLVKYDAISNKDKQRLYDTMHYVFDLHVETKRRCSMAGDALSLYRGGYSFAPIYESFTVTDATKGENLEAFTKLIWPDGNDKFRDVLSSMSTKLIDLNWLLLNMIFDGMGLAKHVETLKEKSDAPFTINKYKDPKKEEPIIGIREHADLGYLTVLGQDEVPGLRIRNNQGDWVEVDPGQSHFVVFIGQSLRAMTNGKLKATYHEVKVHGGKDRFSYGSFLAPKADQIVDVLPGMVTDENPRLFKPFTYGEYSKTIVGVDTLRVFAVI